MAKLPLVAELHRPSWSAKEKPVLEPEQIAKVLANIPYKRIPVCAVIAILGLRIGEALAIKWDRVDLDERTQDRLVQGDGQGRDTIGKV
jgi:integrase